MPNKTQFEEEKPMPCDFSNRLRERRRAMGMTMRELAEKVGVSEAAVGMWETGKRNISDVWLAKLSEVLGCSANDILGYSPDEGKGDPRFSARFHYLRVRSGFTQTQMANILTKIGAYNISRSAVSLWESGARMPSRDNLETISDYFNVPMDYLLGKVDDPTSAFSSQSEMVEVAEAFQKMTPGERENALQILKIAFPARFK